MSNYRRARVPGGTYFFTVNLLNRQSKLLMTHIAQLRETVRQVRQQQPFHIDAWVVLPEHMHCIWTLPSGDQNYAARWKDIKTGFSKRLPKTELVSTARTKQGERGIWQRHYWEHTIRDDEDYAAHVNYCYINPLKHGLVEQVKDWQFSTFHRDVKNGLFPLDWGCENLDMAAGEASWQEG
ncbi:transposase [Betaproteobacteria bacterium]|nr:transposase [Betaproteobacteria bacterium]GHU42821.1 transposase [Betaproteobacteria bacterium]